MSNSVNISFPTTMKSWLQRQSKRSGFSTVGDFIRDLVRKEQERHKIEKKLISSLDSGTATPWTENEWQELQDIIDKKRKPATRKSHVKNGRQQASSV
jgi:antitoxin ParD1/3/4